MPLGTRSLSSASDAELLLDLRQTLERADWEGRNSVITEFYRRYAGSLATTWLRRTGDADLTQELLQETFARATSKLGTLPPDRSVLVWLRTTARNYFLDRKRRAWKDRRFERSEASAQRPGQGPGQHPEEGLVTEIDRTKAETFVGRYIRQLGPLERGVIRLRLEGAGLKQICRRLAISESECRRSYARIRFLLQKMRLRGLRIFSAELLVLTEGERRYR